MAAKAILAVLLIVICSSMAHSQGKVAPRVYRLSIPNQKWALEITLPTYKVDIYNRPKVEPPLAFHLADESLEAGGEFRLMAFGTRSKSLNPPGLWLGIRMKQAPKLNAEEFRTYALKDLVGSDDLKKSSLKTWEYNHIPIARFSLWRRFDDGNQVKGPTPVAESSERHLAAFLNKDEVGACVIASARDFDAEQEKLFYTILDSVKFVDVSNPMTSFDYFHKGRLLYMQKDYRNAVEPFAGAVVLERQQRTLDLELWRELVMDLGNSLVHTGRTMVALDAIQYGISVEPSEWSFHGALARLYASLGDVDHALISLQKTFSLLKAQQVPKFLGPHPSSEPAFRELMKIPRFREAVKAMEK